MALNTGRNMVNSLFVIIGLSTVLYLAIAVFFQVVGHTNDTIVNQVEGRAYQLCILVNYDSTRQTPLVINVNGTAIWPYWL